MKQFLRHFVRATGHGNTLWPVGLFLGALLVPTVSLLWFMNVAIRNQEAAAVHQTTQAYEGSLHLSRQRLDAYWDEFSAELDGLSETSQPAGVFAAFVTSARADSVILYDRMGMRRYPDHTIAPAAEEDNLDSVFAKAGELEMLQRNLLSAAEAYGSIAARALRTNLVARALQAQVRCLVRGGQMEDAARIISEKLSGERFRRAQDSQGRLIIANTELLGIELTRDRFPERCASFAESLKARLLDYTSGIASPQRRFLMHEFEALLSVRDQFPTLPAEELAAEFLGAEAAQHLATQKGIWAVPSSNGMATALFRTSTLQARTSEILSEGTAGSPVEIALLEPGSDRTGSLASAPAGRYWPGWRLAVSPRGGTLASLARSQTHTYYWIAILVVIVASGLAVWGVGLLRREIHRTRLKGDLAATVSHELKTPLASIRLLTDTLLASRTFDGKRVREYLELISAENHRLSRLIESFLTFSRMERRKYQLEYRSVSSREIALGAAQAFQNRFCLSQTEFRVEIDGTLPMVVADYEAMVSALLNLLENAYKFSPAQKRILLRAQGIESGVLFEVEDHGLGISRQAAKRIFQDFYQVDQSLSRQVGGCGLGLGIVRFIVQAHGGEVDLRSQLGEGSTFTIRFPIQRDSHRSRTHC